MVLGVAMPSVPLADAEAPLVLALDLGTSSVRAVAFDRHGRALEGTEKQLPYQPETGADGGVTVDPRLLVDLLGRCVDGVLDRIGERANELRGVGTSCVWHSLLGVDRRGDPVTPVLMWADTRAATAAAELRGEVDETAIHRRTGCRIHASYWPAKLRWLAATRPDEVRRVVRWVSLAEYAALQLHGEATVSPSMASGTGLMDVHQVSWDAPLLDILELSSDHLSPIDTNDTGVHLRAELGRRWPPLAELPWFNALGDGACANAGSGAIGPGRIALTMGTSGAMRLVLPTTEQLPLEVPPDLWAYRLDTNRAVLGGALSNGGNLLRWMRELLAVPVDGSQMEAAAALSPDDHGLTVLPFIAGERSPGWHDHATGLVAGLTTSTRSEHLLRATMEAIAYRFARINDALAPLVSTHHEIVANGGAILGSGPWQQIIADVLEHDLLVLPPDDEASARGAALTTLVALGTAPNLAALPDPAAGATLIHANPTARLAYRAARDRQQRLEALLYPPR